MAESPLAADRHASRAPAGGRAAARSGHDRQHDPRRVVGAAEHVDRHRELDRRRLGKVLLEGQLITTRDLRAGVTAQRIDRLRRCSLFDGFTREELQRLSGAFEETTVAAGEVFIRQGESDAHLYVLASGALSGLAGFTMAAAQEFRLTPSMAVGYGFFQIFQVIGNELLQGALMKPLLP